MRRLSAVVLLSILVAGCGAQSSGTVAPADGTSTQHAINVATMGAVGTKQAAATPTDTPTLDGSAEPSPELTSTATQYPPAPILLPPDQGGPIPEGARFRLGIGAIVYAELSPDGRYMAIGTTAGLYVIETEGFTRVWDAAIQSPVREIAWRPDSEMFAVRSNHSGVVDGYSASSGAATFKLEHTKDVTSIAWSPDGARLAVAWAGTSAFIFPFDTSSISPRLTVWDMNTLNRLYTAEIDNTDKYKPRMGNIVWSPDGTKVAAATAIPAQDPGDDLLNVIVVWDSATGTQTAVLEQRIVHYAAFSLDSKRIATWTGDSGTDAPRGSQDILIWDATTGALLTTLSGEDRSNIYDAYWLAGGKQLISAAGNGKITVWDMDSNTQIQTIIGDGRSFFQHMAVSPDEQKVVAGNSNSTGDGASLVWVWDIMTGKLLTTIGDHREGISAVGWSSDGRVLSISDSLVAMHDAAGGDPLMKLVGNSVFADGLPLHWADDGRTLSSTQCDFTVDWDMSTGKPLAVSPAKPVLRPPADTDTSPDGKLAVWVSASRAEPGDVLPGSTVRVYESATGETAVSLEGPPSQMFKVAWSRDGSRLAVGGGLEEDIFVGFPWIQGWLENMVIVWDTETWEEIGRSVGHNGRVLDLAFSPDGSLLASSSSDGTVIVWQVGP